MIRFGIHSSLWTSAWTREGAERAVSECARAGGTECAVLAVGPFLVVPK